MTNDIQTGNNDVNQGNKPKFAAAIMSQIQKDFEMVGLPLPNELVTTEMSKKWMSKFEKHLQLINNDQNGKLIQLLYRIDVDEKPLLNMDDAAVGYHQLAQLIIEREREKVAFRRTQQ